MSFLTMVTISSEVVICDCSCVAELMQSRTNRAIISANESAGRAFNHNRDMEGR